VYCQIVNCQSAEGDEGQPVIEHLYMSFVSVVAQEFGGKFWLVASD
jgi:hypothetical protein